MFDSPMSAVICLDTDTQTIHIYAETAAQKVSHTEISCRCRPFGEEYYQKLDKALKSFQQKNPAASLAKVSLLLPDHVFLMDTVNIPTIGKRAMDNSLELAVGTIYKNKKDLKYRTYPLAQNKQFSTFGLVGVRKDLLSRLEKVFADNQVGIQNITFTANAMTCGAMTVNPKLKNGTFLLMDVKENSVRYAFVNKGRTVGTYRLPFGHSMLYRSRLAPEDLLFDHSSAELLVLNAKERAKAKQLTMMGEEIMVDPDAMEPEEPAATDDSDLFGTGPNGTKRTARRLPKFMQRDVPVDREGFVYENFRIMMKWTLDLIANNPDITSLGPVDTVYVNMPKDFGFLYKTVNAEEAENKVKFVSLMSGGGSEAASAKLDLFGGLYVKQFNKINNF